MASQLLALLAGLVLLLAGCATNGQDQANNSTMPGNVGIIGKGFNPTSGPKGTVSVTVLEAVSGCGIQPPDGDASQCGEHYSSPYSGQVMVSATDITGIGPSDSGSDDSAARKAIVNLITADSEGKFSFELPAGDYALMFGAGGQGVLQRPVNVRDGHSTELEVKFTRQVPSARPS